MINWLKHYAFKSTCMLCILIFLGGCGKKITYERKKIFLPAIPRTNLELQASDPAITPTITVWIHGTQILPHPILSRIFHGPHGLVKATDFDPQYHLFSIVATLGQTDPTNYPFDHTYLFGWEGSLSFKERRHAAIRLHNQLKELVQKYQKMYGTHPKIRIITHSHGGNVALNLARIHDANSFVVDELIMLACPVQKKTEHLINSNIFKEIFIIYSSIDMIQCIDPQGLYPQKDMRPFFSKKRFEYAPHIMQVKIKLDGHTLLHSDFIRTRFVKLIPGIVEQMREWHTTHGDEIYKKGDAHQLLCVYTNPDRMT